jgi:hypothetical protein
MNRRLLPETLAVMLIAAGCKGTSAPEPLATAREAPASDPSTSTYASPAVASAPLAPTSVAKAGEPVPGDVYDFKVLALRRCSDSAWSIGVEVEITAKAPLAISPRDVRLQSGGVIYYASLDKSPPGPACTPLLPRIALQPKHASKGFVQFDVPPPEPPSFEVVYQPTRWGGAYAASVALTNDVVR